MEPIRIYETLAPNILTENASNIRLTIGRSTPFYKGQDFKMDEYGHFEFINPIPNCTSIKLSDEAKARQNLLYKVEQINLSLKVASKDQIKELISLAVFSSIEAQKLVIDDKQTLWKFTLQPSLDISGKNEKRKCLGATIIISLCDQGIKEIYFNTRPIIYNGIKKEISDVYKDLISDGIFYSYDRKYQYVIPHLLNKEGLIPVVSFGNVEHVRSEATTGEIVSKPPLMAMFTEEEKQANRLPLNFFHPPFKKIIEDFSSRILSLDPSEALDEIQKLALLIFNESIVQMQTNPVNFSERQLYWTRLRLRYMLRNHWYKEPVIENILILRLEYYSRGFDTTSHSFASDEHRIYISGFEPFVPDIFDFGVYGDPPGNPQTCHNPSGRIAQFFYGKSFNIGGNKFKIYSALYPTRWDDFNRGIVEQYFEPLFSSTNADMIISFSLDARTPPFHIEKFAVNFHHPENPDNELKLPGSAVIISGANGFYQTTLPVKRILEEQTTDIPFNNPVYYRWEYGTWFLDIVKDPPPGAGANYQDLPALSSIVDLEYPTWGSGGDYLSNEIFLRNCVVRDRINSSFPYGHIHVPHISSPTLDYLNDVLEIISRAVTELK